MATAETGQTSSLIAIRKVVLPNPELRRFRDQLKVDAQHTFGFIGTNTVEVPAPLNRQLEPGYEAEYEDVGKLEADIFSLHSLRVVVFARRARASAEVNDLIHRAHERLSSSGFYSGRTRIGLTGRKRVAIKNELPGNLNAIQEKEGFRDGTLPVTASGIANVSPAGSSEQIYDLMIDDDTPFARVLRAQHNEIENAVGHIQKAKGLANDVRFAAAVDPLAIRIIRMPGGQNRETERFEEAINLHDPVHFELGPVEWRLK
jgi:hypothetical protein